MSSTNGQVIAERNRKQITLLVPDQSRRDGLLLTAWQRIVRGFKSRPLPRAAWDESFRSEFPYMAFKPVVTPIRAALLAAVASGDRALINTTMEGADAFCEELKADFHSLVPDREAESVTAIALDETQCQSEAEPLEMAFVASPSAIAAERAVLPLERHYKKLGQLIRGLRVSARAAKATPMVGQLR